MTDYLYYVGFIANNKANTQQGPGSVIIKRTEPIRSQKDVEELEKDIRKAKKYGKVKIMGWNRLEE